MLQAVTCPSCNRSYAFKPQLAGKRVTCKCGGKIQFPAAKEEIIASDVLFEDADNLHSPAASTPVKGDESTFPCGNCGIRLPIGTVLCTACGYNHKTRTTIKTQVESGMRLNPAHAWQVARTPAPKAVAAGADYQPLSGVDFLLIIFCSGIAFIIGLVRGAQGKGWDMMIGALIMGAIWGGIRFAIVMASGR